jgi:hypothetical protein
VTFWERDNTMTNLIYKHVYFITVIQDKINNIMNITHDITYFLFFFFILQRNINILCFIDLHRDISVK